MKASERLLSWLAMNEYYRQCDRRLWQYLREALGEVATNAWPSYLVFG